MALQIQDSLQLSVKLSYHPCAAPFPGCLFPILTHSGALSAFRTPEYMSPELLHNGQDGTDQAYDPRSTDVWAAGVMLVVALCGAFPFDHTQHQHRSMEEAELDLWYALCTLASS